MPDQDQSIPPPPPPPTDPSSWEHQEGFRETFLLWLGDPGMNLVFRSLGNFLYNLFVEQAELWPPVAGSFTRLELRAARADLVHLAGFLGSVGREHEVSSLAPEDVALSQFAARQAREVERIADRIDEELKGA